MTGRNENAEKEERRSYLNNLSRKKVEEKLEKSMGKNETYNRKE